MTDQSPRDVVGSALVRDLDAYESLLSVIRRRRSIRKYDPRPVPEEDLMRELEAGRWAPSGANIQPWAFLVVEDAERRGAVAELLIEEGGYLQRKGTYIFGLILDLTEFTGRHNMKAGTMECLGRIASGMFG